MVCLQWQQADDCGPAKTKVEAAEPESQVPAIRLSAHLFEDSPVILGQAVGDWSLPLLVLDKAAVPVVDGDPFSVRVLWWAVG